MDISNLISNVGHIATELAESYCIINGTIVSLSEIQNIGCEEFFLRSSKKMPPRFYRYYPNTDSEDKENSQIVNRSLQALKNNTVFLQTPTQFDDVYDSDININYLEYEHLRLVQYCNKCGIDTDTKWSTSEINNVLIQTLWTYYNTNGNLDNVFLRTTDSEIEHLLNQIFLKNILIELAVSRDFGIAVSKAIQDEYDHYISRLKATFRTSCFTTSPYSQLMWATYANYHKGFCVEYTVFPNHERYKEIYYNLFPMIYCKVRPNVTSRLLDAIDKELTQETMWEIYFHGALRKSIDWAFQNEWRLLLPLNSKNTSNFNLEFFPITKVYLGNRMAHQKRKEIIDICNDKHIEYVGVKRNPSIFAMQDCEIKCESCPQYLHSSDNTK